MLCFLILAWWGTNHILCFSTSLRWCQNKWKVLECSSGPPFSSLSLSLAVLCSISFFTQSFYLFHHMSLDMWYPVSQIGVLILYIGSSVFTSSQRFIKRMCVFGCSVVSLSVTPWTVAHQAPLSMEFSRQEHWSRLPFPSPGSLPYPGIKPKSAALQVDTLPLAPPRKSSKTVAAPKCPIGL